MCVYIIYVGKESLLFALCVCERERVRERSLLLCWGTCMYLCIRKSRNNYGYDSSRAFHFVFFFFLFYVFVVVLRQGDLMTSPNRPG